MASLLAKRVVGRAYSNSPAPPADQQTELAETPRRRTSAARGILIGAALGIVLWVAILVFFGVIRL